jgi:hypothetical protein
MIFSRKRGWRDWFREAFVRQGLFSMRPVPLSLAEKGESAENVVKKKDMTRLNLDSDSTLKP